MNDATWVTRAKDTLCYARLFKLGTEFKPNERFSFGKGLRLTAPFLPCVQPDHSSVPHAASISFIQS